MYCVLVSSDEDLTVSEISDRLYDLLRTVCDVDFYESIHDNLVVFFSKLYGYIDKIELKGNVINITLVKSFKIGVNDYNINYPVFAGNVFNIELLLFCPVLRFDNNFMLNIDVNEFEIKNIILYE